ncbi:nucleosidase [Nocardioides bizhenqiangii]|uniref:Nucleosidase n=1 Tax=Nocardioides bizhenqiangii TaxID=3095076 RepID=A0ABZ0ZLI3_9ACTN|nr:MULTISPECIES: nucleosidase [unclassified Nocardioides]MDZ5620240.1 nucleosidase [Nocardioides sp. HM23]WQQ24616.1 nucleosidase [Nocardioides sp. HM61]
MTRHLVVAATRAEAAYVPSSLPVLVTGIGKTAAATAVARALASYDDLSGLEVVNVGTAGALHDHHEGLHEPGVVLNHDVNADAIRALGYDPQERLRCGPGAMVLATGDVFVTDPVVRERLAAQADLVDMEGYAVAYAALQFDVPVRLVKHVSDRADESAMDWPTLVDRSARSLGEWLARTL